VSLRDLWEALPNLLCSKGADAVQTESEDKTVFVSQTHIEGRLLRRNRATLPGIADSRGRTNEGSIAAGE